LKLKGFEVTSDASLKNILHKKHTAKAASSKLGTVALLLEMFMKGVES
jgi:hypothetical protein